MPQQAAVLHFRVRVEGVGVAPDGEERDGDPHQLRLRFPRAPFLKQDDFGFKAGSVDGATRGEYLPFDASHAHSEVDKGDTNRSRFYSIWALAVGAIFRDCEIYEMSDE